ncbi:MAG: alpha/beta hydrolase [Candidatus Nitrosotenuis sp.]|nr:alpha/beta hydrolase [Candidatus Nitrosotenuis sp.]
MRQAGHDSSRINVVDFKSDNSAKTLVCIHGLCCDSRIFNYFGRHMAKAGINVISIDLPGHGMSGGEPGDPDFEQCLRAIDETVSGARARGKVYVLAHSIGCTFALWYARKFRTSFDGLILLAPYVRVKIKKRSEVEPSVSDFIYMILRRITTPHSKVNVAKALRNYTRIGGREIAEMLKDVNLNFMYSYRYLVDTVAIRNSKTSQVSDIAVPLLILHGTKDKQVYPDVSNEFYKMAKSADKTIRMFDCDHWFYDAIFYNQDFPGYSEESRKEVLDTVSEWISSR